jgi:hypothetical protein
VWQELWSFGAVVAAFAACLPIESTANADEPAGAGGLLIQLGVGVGLLLEAAQPPDLLAALAALTRNQIRLRCTDASFDQLAQATPLQARAFELLELNPSRL